MDQTYKVRDESRARIKKAILGLPLKKNESGNYNHADAQIFLKRIDRELERQHNEFTSDGMKGLVSADPDNELVKLRSTVTITWKDVLKASKKAAVAKQARTGKTKDAKPDIESPTDARKEADRHNIEWLAAVGAKEGVIDTIQEKIGSVITDSVLKTSDGTESKTVDQIELYVS